MLQKQLEGSLTLIKDGKEKVISLTFSEERIQEIKEKYKKLSKTHISCFTQEEKDMPQLIDAFTLTDYYQELLKKGYCILREVPKILLNATFSHESPQDLTCMIPEKLSKEDQILLEKSFKERKNKNQATIISLYGNDFDLYVKDSFSIASTEQVLTCFLEEKTNPKLSEQMRKMFHLYRNGDFSSIMLNTDYDQYPVNNTGGGIIVITGDKTIEKPLRKRSHIEELRKIMIELDEELKDLEVESSYDFVNLISAYSIVTIQYSTVGVSMFTPNELTEYQYQTLMEKLMLMQEIVNKRGKELNPNRDFYLSSYGLSNTTNKNFIQGLKNIQMYLEQVYKNSNYSSNFHK